jgi:predicted transcriptional regulator
MAKRERLEIIKDILKIINDNRAMKITPLIRRSNLSTSRFKEYFGDLLRKGFVVEKNKTIKITEKGSRFLEKYQTILHFIDEFDL